MNNKNVQEPNIVVKTGLILQVLFCLALAAITARPFFRKETVFLPPPTEAWVADVRSDGSIPTDDVLCHASVSVDDEHDHDSISVSDLIYNNSTPFASTSSAITNIGKTTQGAVDQKQDTVSPSPKRAPTQSSYMGGSLKTWKTVQKNATLKAKAAENLSSSSEQSQSSVQPEVTSEIVSLTQESGTAASLTQESVAAVSLTQEKACVLYADPANNQSDVTTVSEYNRIRNTSSGQETTSSVDSVATWASTFFFNHCDPFGAQLIRDSLKSLVNATRDMENKANILRDCFEQEALFGRTPQIVFRLKNARSDFVEAKQQAQNARAVFETVVKHELRHKMVRLFPDNPILTQDDITAYNAREDTLNRPDRDFTEEEAESLR